MITTYTPGRSWPGVVGTQYCTVLHWTALYFTIQYCSTAVLQYCPPVLCTVLWIKPLSAAADKTPSDCTVLLH